MREPRQVEPESEGAGGFGFLLQVALSEWGIILLAVLFSLAAGYLYVRSQEPSYAATSVIEMSLSRPRILKKDEAVIEDAYWRSTEEIVSTRILSLSGATIRRRVAEEVRAAHPNLGVGEEAIRQAADSATLTRVKDTRLVNISQVSKVPSLPVPVVNAYARVAAASVKEEMRKTWDSAVEWLREQQAAQRLKLSEAEAVLRKSREDEKISAAESEKQALGQLLATINEAIVKAEAETAISRGVLDSLSKAAQAPENLGEVPSAVPFRATIEQQSDKLNQLVTARALLLDRYTPQHPKVEELSNSIDVHRRQLTQTIERARQTAEANLKLLESQTEDLRRKKVEQEKRMGELDKILTAFAARVEGLNREIETVKTSLDDLSQRIEEARLSTEENTAAVRVVQEALPPPSPIRPQAPRTLLLSGVLGLVLGGVLGYISYRLKDAVSAMTDVQAEFGVPVLGAVPHVDGKPNMVTLAGASAGDTLHMVGEAFAHIRTALNAWRAAKHVGSCALVVTAPDANAGKTITSCNLAIALAHAGRRTLLVDGDSRRPAIHRVFSASRDKPSLIAALQDGTEACFREAAQRTEVPNLDVVVCGKHEKNIKPTRALAGDSLRRFVAWARTQYDYILFDSPPAGIFSDAVVMGAAADGVLLVCRYDQTRKMMMRQMTRRLADSGLEAAGIVINDLRESRLGSRLGYGGYYGYGHYYDDYGRAERARQDEAKETGKK